MIGRHLDLQQLEDLTAQHPLVTITGPPGVGKSTLARAALERLEPSGAHRRWCDLGQIDPGDDLADAVANQLGSSSYEALALALTGEATVLVLDDADRLVDAGLGDFVSSVLERCPDVRLLVTSRRPLAVADEQVWVLTPLPLPDDTSDDEALARNESVALYLERAAAAGARLAVDDPVLLRQVGALVRELDGLPMAIELAAARARSVGPGDFLARLGDRLELLRASGSGPGGDRRAMRSTLSLSYDLLTQQERRLFRRLSIFRGPIAADLVHLVCDAAPDEVGTLDLLSELVERSLVDSQPSRGGTVRYRLLHLVRDHAASELEREDETATVRERFIDLLAAMADRFAAGASEGWTEELVARMLGCFANLTGAIDLCIEHDDDGSRAFRLYLPLYSAIHGTAAGEVAALGQRLLRRWPTGPEPLRPEATAVAAAASLLAGDDDAAVGLAWRVLDDPASSPLAQLVGERTLAFAAWYAGRAEDARASVDRALAAAARWGGPFQRELLVVRAAMCAEDDPARALDELRTVARESAAANESITRLWALVAAAHVLVRTGRDADATLLIDDAAALAGALGDGWGRGAVARVRAVLTARAHGWAASRPAWLVALDHAVAAGDRGALTVTLDHAAALARELDALDDAAELDALRLGDRPRTVLPPMVDVSPASSAGGVPGADFPAIVRRARAVFGRGPGATPSDPAPASTTSPTPTTSPTLRRTGDTWTVIFAGTSATVRHVKGLHDLARLLAKPGVEVHCLDLMDAGAVEADTGPALDHAARRAYEDRIRALQDDIDEADAHHDTARAELARAELDALVAQLGQALGFGGRDRPDGTAERARAAVRWRLRSAIERVTRAHGPLGRHLDRSVRTGTWCVYAPDEPVDWTIDLGPES